MPPGLSRCEGSFRAGEIVRICDANGTEFARGICRFSSAEVNAQPRPRTELVHRDDLVVL